MSGSSWLITEFRHGLSRCFMIHKNKLKWLSLASFRPVLFGGKKCESCIKIGKKRKGIGVYFCYYHIRLASFSLKNLAFNSASLGFQ